MDPSLSDLRVSGLVLSMPPLMQCLPCRSDSLHQLFLSRRFASSATLASTLALPRG